MNETHSRQLIPIMFAFFVMGFVDLVGIATNYIKVDFQLSDTIANLLPSMVFLWFLIFSVPTGLLMNKIGRRKTVILSLVITLFAMLTPLAGYNFTVMMISFSLLGIGNTLMQVSLNPLVINIVKGDRLASSLTLGQFFKAIASFLAPIIAVWAAVEFNNWRMLYPLFAVITILPILGLLFTPIKESPIEGKVSTFGDCFELLRNKGILLLFIGILVHVGIDVGINLTGPKLLMEKLHITLADAGYAASVYFLFRTIGCFLGAFILSKIRPKIFFSVSVGAMVLAVVGLFVFDTMLPIYTCIALIGFGNSNVFPIIFSQAMQLLPMRNNEVSGLMIMGISGGTVFPLLMGVASDALESQVGAIWILAICIAYLLFLARSIK